MTKVINSYGRVISFESAVSLMDDGVREETAMFFDEDASEQEFFEMYCEMHEARLGEEFEPNKLKAQW